MIASFVGLNWPSCSFPKGFSAQLCTQTLATVQEPLNIVVCFDVLILEIGKFGTNKIRENAAAMLDIYDSDIYTSLIWVLNAVICQKMSVLKRFMSGGIFSTHFTKTKFKVKLSEHTCFPVYSNSFTVLSTVLHLTGGKIWIIAYFTVALSELPKL